MFNIYRMLFYSFGEGQNGINSWLNPFISLKDTLGLEAFRPLFLSRIVSQFSFKAVYVTVVGVNLEICDV